MQRKYPLMFIGSDHGGFILKEALKLHLKSNSLICKDLGTYSKENVNYVDIASSVAVEVIKNRGLGILCCSSGIGVSIASNKIDGIRAALCTTPYHAEFAKRHNNANIMCFGEKVTSKEGAIEMIKIFLNTDFEGGRHKKRIDRIFEIELNRVKK